MFTLSDHDRGPYSPEASDTHPWGDWQTRAVVVGLVVAALALILLVT